MNEIATMELRTMDKVRVPLTQTQANAVLQCIKNGDKYVILKGAYILTSTISGIYPLELVEEKTVGRLHDGTRVVKQYGRWCDADNPDVVLNMSYYPELATDNVMTEREWEIKKSERLLGDGGVKSLEDGHAEVITPKSSDL